MAQFETLGSFFSAFRKTNPEAEAYSDDVLYSTAVLIDPSVRGRIAEESPEPKYSTASGLLSAFRGANATAFR